MQGESTISQWEYLVEGVASPKGSLKVDVLELLDGVLDVEQLQEQRGIQHVDETGQVWLCTQVVPIVQFGLQLLQ